MALTKLNLVVDDVARQSLQEAYLHIRKDSLQNAAKVKNKILASFKDLIKNPERHAPDKYRLNNDGSYHAYELYKYRISYHVSTTEIRILRIRHTKMNPLEY